MEDLSANLLSRDKEAIWHPFTQHGLGRQLLPVAGGMGAVLRDVEGREYLDMISSWWVNLHGHGRPELAKAVADQILNLDHVQFAGATHEPAVLLAERLLEAAGLRGKAKVFYSDNGSTAVEVALKIAHQNWVNQGTPRKFFAVLEGGYHGDTVGAMSVGRSSGFFDSFSGMMFETTVLPVPLIWRNFQNEEGEGAALSKIAALLGRSGDQMAGLIVEPLVQGAGGMRFHSPRYLRELCRLFQERSIPVIFDEVMTGFGRTGSFFAYQQTSVIPDMICLSKGITGGILPLSATIASNPLFESFLGDDFSSALAHGHSYTANPVACAAALCSLDLHKQMDSLGQVARMNKRMAHHLEKLGTHPKIEHPRLLGGILAFDLVTSSRSYSAAAGRELTNFAQENGVLMRPIGNVLYLIPPYCTSDEQLDRVFGVIGEFLGSH
ncbi:MAG: adenosylmethionine--8-amino-7-oxononanoate transaminase [Verrucomicrobia bacterium]|nr:adenosylmethionine--8-amino-7-oxononanoate transaminase [Verrucomicrobiota bacterium]